MSNDGKLNIDQLLAELNETLNDTFGSNLQRCVLFGSHTRQEQTNDSDVDVLVLLNLSNEEIKNYQKKLDEISLELSLKYDVVLSLLVKNSEEFYQYSTVLPLYNNIVKEGKQIYG